MDWKLFRETLHYAITATTLAIPIFARNCFLLLGNAILCLLVLIHWLTNNGKCALSEYDHTGNSYTIGLLRLIGIKLPTNDMYYSQRIAYGVLFLVAAVSLGKAYMNNCLATFPKKLILF